MNSVTASETNGLNCSMSEATPPLSTLDRRSSFSIHQHVLSVGDHLNGRPRTTENVLGTMERLGLYNRRGLKRHTVMSRVSTKSYG